MPRGTGRPENKKIRGLLDYANIGKEAGNDMKQIKQSLAKAGQITDKTRADSAAFENKMASRIRGGEKMGKPGDPYGLGYKKGGLVKPKSGRKRII